MSLQGPIVVIAEQPDGGLVQALTAAGAFPVVEARWAEAAKGLAALKPAAVVLTGEAVADPTLVQAVDHQLAAAEPFIPVLARIRGDAEPALPNALAVPSDAPVEHLVARLAFAQRLRAQHATVLRRARVLKEERNIVAELPASDPLEDATVLVVGRGRSHPVLSVAVGERMGVMGALSVEAAARCLNAREVDGIAIGEGLSARSVSLLLDALAEDVRFRELPVGLLGTGALPDMLPNLLQAADPATLVERMLPLIRLRVFEGRLKRLLHSIEHKGMLDVRTGLLHADAFGRDLTRAIDEAAERGGALSIARFSFEQAIDRRASMDAARLVSRLMRNVDFACRQDDGSIVAVFTETDLRAAHVVARRLASVLKHTMLRPGREQPPVSPSVTLATLKPADTVTTLMARVAPRPVAAA
jgi:GGDEF domain-containing protein